MPDPISPLGATGQIQPLNPAPTPAAPQNAAEGSAVQASPTVAQAAAVLGLSDAARQELAKQQQAASESKAVSAPMSLEDAVKAFRDYLKNLPSDLQFRPDRESGLVIFKVVNPVTQEVIRQYPPDEMVRMARYLKAAANQGKSGIFLDEKS